MEDKEVFKMWWKFFLDLVIKMVAAWFILLAAASLLWLLVH